MTIRQSTFHSNITRSEIHRVSAKPDDSTPNNRGIVLVLHGLGDHIGCHEKAMAMFCERGYRAEGFDWPGNGKSSGNRGDIPGVRPALKLLMEVIESLDEKPVAIYAHSTGAFLALPFITREDGSLPLQWIWLSSPLVHPTYRQSRAKLWMAELLAEWVPELTIPTGVKPSRCYHVNDWDVVTIAEQFKDCHSKISTRFGRDLILWESEVARAATQLRDPLRILMTQGDEDLVCPPEFAGKLFHSIPAKNKTFLLLKGMRHEPLREPENQTFLESVRSWLKANS